MTKKRTIKKKIVKIKLDKRKTVIGTTSNKGVKKKGVRVSPLVLAKFQENPIISPKPENGWEAWQTFNPGAILLDDKVHFLYRAIGSDGISRLGYAISSDGFNIDERLPYPVFEHKIKERIFNIYSYFSGGSWGGCEDPRITQVDDEDVLYVLYTACDNGLRVGLTSIKVEDFLNKKWKWRPSVLISPPGEVHKNWVIFPEKINGQYAILHNINPEITIDYFDSLEFSAKGGSASGGEDNVYIKSCYESQGRKNCWDNYMRGAGAPPVKTKDGWLLFYHAMDARDMSKYKVGAMLLDLKNPTKILYRSPQPILEPTEFYENNGFKAGVVYVSGAVVKNGNLLIYYGGADSCVCIASANLKEFLEALRKGNRPKLKQGLLKKNI